MRKRLFLLLVIYIGLYILLHLAYDLPNMVNGKFRFVIPAPVPLSLIFSLADVALYFLFVLIPYYTLYYFYPRRTGLAIVLIVVAIPVLFYLCFRIELFKVFLRSGGASSRMNAIIWASGLRLRTFFLKNVFYAFTYAVFGVVFFFIRYAQFKELQQKDSVIQNRQSELSFLRSQINPHFLFNSLHNIYSLMYQNAAGAQEAILGLSDLLRYMLYDASEKVPLQKEIDYITRYIALQKIRFEHPIHAPIHVTGNTNSMQIPPLLLIPFVENAFKHGDFSGSDQGVNVTIHAGARTIYFHCDNLKGHGLKDAVGGIGLQNVQRRLDILYPGKHLLKIEDKEDRFIINLEITHE